MDWSIFPVVSRGTAVRPGHNFRTNLRQLRAHRPAVRPAQYVGTGWRTSTTKVLDKAVIGYCKISNISPVRA
jgi:hypothetical protein